jgi:hypothetical protein
MTDMQEVDRPQTRRGDMLSHARTKFAPRGSGWRRRGGSCQETLAPPPRGVYPAEALVLGWAGRSRHSAPEGASTARIERITRRMARHGGRILPGRGGGDGKGAHAGRAGARARRPTGELAPVLRVPHPHRTEDLGGDWAHDKTLGTCRRCVPKWTLGSPFTRAELAVR